MKKVLILSTGNSCRSILAEALVNHFLLDSWMAFSAGTHPSEVNPRAITVLSELGINTDNLRSKSVTEFLHRDDLDLVITVCDHAKESCPLFLIPIAQKHLGFADPAVYSTAPDETALPKFRETRDLIKDKLLQLLRDLS